MLQYQTKYLCEVICIYWDWQLQVRIIWCHASTLFAAMSHYVSLPNCKLNFIYTEIYDQISTLTNRWILPNAKCYYYYYYMNCVK
jgi:hypothetical protein